MHFMKRIVMLLLLSVMVCTLSGQEKKGETIGERIVANAYNADSIRGILDKMPYFTLFKDNYFLGATTNEEARTLTIPLDFLEKDKKYHAVIYADGEDADWKTNPTSYQIKDREVTAADTLSVVMAKGGGQAVSFIPVTD